MCQTFSSFTPAGLGFLVPASLYDLRPCNVLLNRAKTLTEAVKAAAVVPSHSLNLRCELPRLVAKINFRIAPRCSVS